MKLKQTLLFLTGIVALASLVSFSNSSTVSAYTCKGTEKVWVGVDANRKDVYENRQLKFDPNSNACYVVKPGDRQGDAPTDSAGNALNCPSGQIKITDASKKTSACYSAKNSYTNQAPIKNDGTPAAADAWSCGSADAYDASKHRCVEKDCGPFDPCDEHLPGLNKPDTTVAPCVPVNVAGPLSPGRVRCNADGSNPNAQNSGGSTATAGDKKESGTGTCGKARTNIIDCGEKEGVDALGNVLKIVLFILTILIGIVAVGGIVYGAILYASASDNAGQVNQAKTIIRDVAIGLLLYGFMIAIINWLVPGGVIG